GGDRHGCLPRRLHEDRRPRDRHDHLWPGAGLFRRGARDAAGGAARRWPPRAVARLRGHRQAGGRAHAGQDGHQRAPARLIMTEPDPVALAAVLIRQPSVTAEDAGALAVLEAALEPLGFICERMRFETPGTPAIDNLWARTAGEGPLFCFAGHTDVVPPGDTAAWRYDP